MQKNKKHFFIFYLLILSFTFLSCQEGNTDLNLLSTCKDITCSGHGHCFIENSQAICECEDGYKASGLNCILDQASFCESWEFFNEESKTCELAEGYCKADANCQASEYCDLTTHTCKEKSKSCHGVTCGGKGACVLNEEGFATCDCFEGYTQEGLNCLKDYCHDVNCGEHANCTQENEEATCVCDTGFYMKDGVCVTDYCHNIECGENQVCQNGMYSHACVCGDNYLMVNGECINKEEVPECSIEAINRQEPLQVKVGGSECENTELENCSNIQFLGHLRHDLKKEENSYEYHWSITGNFFENYQEAWKSFPNKDPQNQENTSHHYVNFYIPYLTPENTYYEAQLTIIDRIENKTYTCKKQFTSYTDENLYIELTWSKSADLDLHLLHPHQQDLDPTNLPNDNSYNKTLEAWRALTNAGWFNREENQDCYWNNCKTNSLEWGNPIINDDNPTLDRDDTVGIGPEIITIKNPSEGWYRIATHLFQFKTETQNVISKVKVFCHGELSYQKSQELNTNNSFWLNTDLYWEKNENGDDVCHFFNEDRIYSKKQGKTEGYQGYMLNDDCDMGYDGPYCQGCDENYHIEEDNMCIENTTCEQITCTELHRTQCDDSTGTALCLCDVNYELNENGDCVRAPDDRLEPNNWEPFTPHVIALGEHQTLYLNPNTEDVYQVTLAENQLLTINLNFSDVAGNIDLFLYKQEDLINPVAFSESFNDNENINYTATTAGDYIIRIKHAWESEGLRTPYSLTLE